MAPFAIYPLPPATRAKLICDLLIFETYLDPASLVSACETADLRAEVELPLAHGDIPTDGAVITIFRDTVGLTLRTAGLNILLFELVQPECWASGVREVLAMNPPPTEPVIVFADEGNCWVPLET